MESHKLVRSGKLKCGNRLRKLNNGRLANRSWNNLPDLVRRARSHCKASRQFFLISSSHVHQLPGEEPNAAFSNLNHLP
jgi:hypothetical protein